MKKILLFGLLLFFGFSFCFSEDTNVGGINALEKRVQERKFYKIDEILDMQQESKQLTKNDKYVFYDSYSKNFGLIAGSLGLNILVPGTGSLLLGDFGGGIPLLSASVLGGGLFLAGILTMDRSVNYFVFNMFSVFGLAILGVSEVMGLIIPFTYSSEWNYRLFTGLHLAFQYERANYYASSMQYEIFKTKNLFQISCPLMEF